MPALVPLDSAYGAMLIGAMLAMWSVQSLSQQLSAHEPSGCLGCPSYNFTYISLVSPRMHRTLESSYVRPDARGWYWCSAMRPIQVSILMQAHSSDLRFTLTSEI